MGFARAAPVELPTRSRSAEQLEQTLEEEKAADEKLSVIAEDQINQRAAA